MSCTVHVTFVKYVQEVMVSIGRKNRDRKTIRETETVIETGDGRDRESQLDREGEGQGETERVG